MFDLFIFFNKHALVFLSMFSFSIFLLRVVLGQFLTWNYLSSSFYLYFNLNKWFSHIFKFFSSWFRHLSVVVCCSSSCATFFDCPSCCGVHLIHIERSKIWASTLQIRRHNYSDHFYFSIYFCRHYVVICY